MVKLFCWIVKGKLKQDLYNKTYNFCIWQGQSSPLGFTLKPEWVTAITWTVCSLWKPERMFCLQVTLLSLKVSQIPSGFTLKSCTVLCRTLSVSAFGMSHGHYVSSLLSVKAWENVFLWVTLLRHTIVHLSLLLWFHNLLDQKIWDTSWIIGYYSTGSLMS